LQLARRASRLLLILSLRSTPLEVISSPDINLRLVHAVRRASRAHRDFRRFSMLSLCSKPLAMSLQNPSCYSCNGFASAAEAG